MMLASQAWQTMLPILNYLVNLMYITGNVYYKILRLKAYNDTLWK